MISFQPNTVEETDFRSHKILLQNLQHQKPKPKHNKHEDFTKSCVFQSENRQSNSVDTMGKHKDFFSSVHVVATGKGEYRVYQPSISYAESRSEQTHDSDHVLKCSASSSQISSNNADDTFSVRSFQHHISNLSHGQSKRTGASRSLLVSSVDEEQFHERNEQKEVSNFEKSLGGKLNKKNRRKMKDGKKDEMKSTCCCKTYHSHTFSRPEFCRVLDISPIDFELSLSKTRADLIEANEKHLIICNTFWRPCLSMSQFQQGDDALPFDSLWLDRGSLKELLRDGIQNTILRSTISELTMMGVSVGPLHLLKSLIDLSLVRVDSVLEDGSGLLHHACVFQRSEVIQYLVDEGVSPMLKDRQGNTAEHYCHCNKICRLLPQKYQYQITGRRGSGGKGNTGKGYLLQPSIQDKDVMFRLAETAKSLMEIQKKLQIFEFNVNTECNSQGDFLVHIATKGGLCQLPLLMLLLRIQKADIELCNSKGMTPLMLASQEGETILCEALMCVFGASPDKCNVHNGKTALHYAAQHNHVDTVSCLIRRGADFNKEDHSGKRPDDSWMSGYGEDCLNIINVHRTQRSEHLTQLNKEGKLRSQDLRDSDLCVVNSDGFTLLMTAALLNRVDSMKVILDFDSSVTRRFIDAQYFQASTSESGNTGIITGMTALAMAAHKGHTLCVSMLLQRGANSVIGDMNGYLPLHHAVLQDHEEVVEAMLNVFPDTYSGLHKACKICKKSSLHKKLRIAWQRRQDEIVMTELMSCAMSGRAEELYRLLEEGDSINSQTGVGSYPLYLAAENGHLDVVRLLCERGADVRKRHIPTGSMALHVAARMGKLEVVEYLLQFTTSRSGRDSSNRHFGSGHSHSKLDINAINAESKTPLQLAAEKGFMRIVKTLLAKGATTALLDSHGFLFSLSEYGGVFNVIESHRHQHANAIMKYIQSKSKKRLQELQQIWMPCFDHNLRDRNGDTPLMVACNLGRADIVSFLLMSAVYPQDNSNADTGSGDSSDADSGVLDTAVSGVNKLDESGDSLGRDLTFFQKPGSDSGDFPSSGQWAQATGTTSRPASRLENLLIDVDKPKGFAIYHDGIVSHVCAVNLFDSSTPLHRCIEGGDFPVIVESLVNKDITCINAQNSSGLTPLHLACKLVRKKSLEKILSVEGLDINLPTLNGQLAEEMTSNKTVIKMVHKARRGHPVRQKSSSSAQIVSPASSVYEAGQYTSKAPSTTGSTINLEKVHERFEQLRNCHQLKQSKEMNKK